MPDGNLVCEPSITVSYIFNSTGKMGRSVSIFNVGQLNTENYLKFHRNYGFDGSHLADLKKYLIKLVSVFIIIIGQLAPLPL